MFNNFTSKLQDAAKQAMDKQKEVMDNMAASSRKDPEPASRVLAGGGSPSPVAINDEESSLDPGSWSPERVKTLLAYEKRYPDILKAFKQISQERKQLEAIVKDATPLDGLGDIELFKSHLQSLSMQKTASAEEIKRLSSLNSENVALVKALQKKMQDTLEVQKLEASTKAEIFEGLRVQLEQKEEELHNLKKSSKVAPSPVAALMSGESEAELQRKVIELAATVKKYGDKLGKMMDKAKSLQEENVKLKSQLELTGVAVESEQDESPDVVVAKISSLEDECQSLSQEVEKWQTRAKQATQEAKDCLKREADLTRRIEELESVTMLKRPTIPTGDAVEIKNELELTRARLRDVSENLEHIKLDLEAKNNKLVNEKEARDCALTRAELADQKVAGLEKDKFALEEKIIALTTEVELGHKVKSENQTLESRIASLVEKLASLTSESSSLKAELELSKVASEVREHSSSLIERIGQLDQLLLDAAEREEMLKAEFGALKKSSADKDELIDGLNQKVIDLERETSHLHTVSLQYESSNKTDLEIKDDAEKHENLLSEMEACKENNRRLQKQLDEILLARESDKASHAAEDIFETSNLQKEIDRLNCQLAVLTEDKARTKEDLENYFKSELAKAAASSDDHLSRVNELEKSLSAAKEQENVMRKALKEIRGELEEAKTKAVYLADENAKIDLERTKLEGEIALQQKALSDANHAIRQKESFIKDLQSSSDAVSKKEQADRLIEIERLNSQINSLKNQVSETEKSSTALKETLEKTVNLLRQTKAQLVKLTADHGSVTQELDSLRHSSAAIAVERDDLKSNLESVSSRLTESLKKAEVAYAEVSALKQELERSQSETSQLKLQTSSDKRKVEELTEQLSHMKHDLLEADEKLGIAKNADAEYKSKISHLVEKIEILAHELETSKKLFEQRTEENSALRARILESEVRFDSANKESRMIEQEQHKIITSLRSEIETLQIAHDEVQGRVSLSENAIDEANGTISHLQAQLTSLMKEHHQCEEQLKSVKVQFQQAEVERKMYLSRCSDMEAQLVTLRAEDQSRTTKEAAETDKLSLLRTAIDDLEARERRLQELNKTLKNELTRIQPRPDSAMSTSEPSPAVSTKNNDVVNYEYLRNVIYRYLIDIQHRPQLVPVLANIFKFSKDEIAKVNANSSMGILEMLSQKRISVSK